MPGQDDVVINEKNGDPSMKNGGVQKSSSSPETKRRHSRNMNMHGVFLHVLADALGSIIVIISALIVKYVDSEYTCYVDPALSVILVIIIIHSTLPLRK